ncbi:MAG: hypothetical protein V4598_08525 [Bdellovibrionota bacterium]
MALIISMGVFANSFALKDSKHAFTLEINARTLSYVSGKRKVEKEILPCNLHLVRALNAELLGHKHTEKGIPFQVDGNTYNVSPDFSLDQRMMQFEREEKKACSQKTT